ncbi:MAG TPA: response regulator, partial [Planctomycetota bacterium]|nr:response regulator [Planctomycetota bacterium]
MKRLLLVEDDRQLAELVRFHFDRAGYEVTRTGDGEEALILAEEVRPDLVILDWMMPGLDGMGVLKRLRADPATAGTAVMVYTASDDPQVAWDATRLGAL